MLFNLKIILNMILLTIHFKMILSNRFIFYYLIGLCCMCIWWLFNFIFYRWIFPIWLLSPAPAAVHTICPRSDKFCDRKCSAHPDANESLGSHFDAWKDSSSTNSDTVFRSTTRCSPATHNNQRNQQPQATTGFCDNQQKANYSRGVSHQEVPDCSSGRCIGSGRTY